MSEPRKEVLGCLMRRCFWLESGRCFDERLGPIPLKNDGFSRLGHWIDEAHLHACQTTPRKGKH